MTKVISVRIDDKLAEALDFQAAAQQLTATELIKRFIVEGLKEENPYLGLIVAKEFIELRKSKGLPVREETWQPIMQRCSNERTTALERYPDYDEEGQASYLIEQSKKYSI